MSIKWWPKQYMNVELLNPYNITHDGRYMYSIIDIYEHNLMKDIVIKETLNILHQGFLRLNLYDLLISSKWKYQFESVSDFKIPFFSKVDNPKERSHSRVFQVKYYHLLKQANLKEFGRQTIDIWPLCESLLTNNGSKQNSKQHYHTADKFTSLIVLYTFFLFFYFCLNINILLWYYGLWTNTSIIITKRPYFIIQVPLPRRI